MKICLAASLMAFLVTAAVAAEEFYVVQNPKTGNCKISNKKDDGQNLMIGNVLISDCGGGQGRSEGGS
jgi:hypothetical protein